ncbi:MAG: 50S ribosomal protein L25 [Candidatus Hydrogenedentes bacterium]|nr:50S ribosomal protein L25 [Candidatus Hydrogenedentota bacterium]
MQMEKLAATARPETGKGPASRVRAQGLIPGVVYGHVEAPASISFNRRSFEVLMAHHRGGNAMIELEVAGDDKLSGPTMVKAIQRHPSRDNVLHVDFQRIDLDEKIQISVPLKIVGNIAGVLAGGVLEYHLRELLIESTARDLPDSIEVDLTDLQVGQGFRVGEMKPIENVRVLTDPHRYIGRIMASRVAKGDAKTGKE